MEIFQMIASVPYLSEALQLIMAGHALALAIVNMTESPKDNDMLKKVYGYVEIVAGLVGSKAKK